MVLRIWVSIRETCTDCSFTLRPREFDQTKSSSRQISRFSWTPISRHSPGILVSASYNEMPPLEEKKPELVSVSEASMTDLVRHMPRCEFLILD